MKDEIIEELWKIKEQIASETKGSTRTLFEHLRAIESKSSHRKVNLTRSRNKQHA